MAAGADPDTSKTLSSWLDCSYLTSGTNATKGYLWFSIEIEAMQSSFRYVHFWFHLKKSADSQLIRHLQYQKRFHVQQTCKANVSLLFSAIA
jgi:hypothetical protein